MSAYGQRQPPWGEARQFGGQKNFASAEMVADRAEMMPMDTIQKQSLAIMSVAFFDNINFLLFLWVNTIFVLCLNATGSNRFDNVSAG